AGGVVIDRVFRHVQSRDRQGAALWPGAGGVVIDRVFRHVQSRDRQGCWYRVVRYGPKGPYSRGSDLIRSRDRTAAARTSALASWLASVRAGRAGSAPLPIWPRAWAAV